MTDHRAAALRVRAFEVSAPGRVNVIGGHVDFHEGIVVCAAIDRRVRARGAPRSDGRVIVTSDQFDGTVDVPVDGGAKPSMVEPGWGRLVAAMLAELADRGRPSIGFNAVISSDLAIGGGLSSSAAFEIMIGRAATAVASAAWHIDDVELAKAAQAAEHRATGVPCGIQDQMASVLGGLFVLDCRSLTVTPLSLPEECALLVVDSGVARTLEGSPWAARRFDSFTAARDLGIEVLRDAAAIQVADHPQGRHVVGEIERVRRFVAAMTAGDVNAAGRLMVESHHSSAQNYGSSTRELDVLVEELMRAGAYGARLTGGGFGGCVVALVPQHERARIGVEVATSYQRRVGVAAEILGVSVAES